MSFKEPRIGILGGTFDPVHLGHIHIAKAALYEFDLDEIWFMPAGDPYFKEEKGFTDSGVRLAMVKSCLKSLGIAAFRCSDYEINDVTATYTADTLAGLREAYPDCRFYFILGYDSLKAIGTWHTPDAIFRNAVILAALRDEADYSDIDLVISRLRDKYPGADIRPIHTAVIDISSTMVRNHAALGQSISGLVTPDTEEFIRQHGLYNIV